MKFSGLLVQPVPDYSSARENKDGYRLKRLALDANRNTEPLVDIAQYGLAGQSYYSRPNWVLGVIDDLLPTVWLRQSLAERLAAINYEMQRCDELAHLFGGKVELFIEEGLRPMTLQKRLYEEVYPDFIRKQHPKMSEEQVKRERDELIASPAKKGESPAPHATGAAIDISLRFAQPQLGFALRAKLPLSVHRFHTEKEAYPDFYEHKKKMTTHELLLQRNRRIVYWLMRGALMHEDSQFVVNPTEWWHWSYGDQMWAVLSNAPKVLFAIPEESPPLFVN